MPREVVHGRFDRPSGAQLVQVAHQQVGLERVGMVVVERGALFEPEIVAIAIVPIVLEDRDLVIADALDDPADDGGFARRRAACHADDQRDGSRLL